MRRWIVLCIIVLGLGNRAGAGVEALRDDPDVRSNLVLLEKWIGEQLDYRGIPGVALAVVYDQEIVWSKGFGVADLSTRQAVTPQTIFRIASITKTFTSTAILILRDQGKLMLDDPVSQYLPWFTYKNRFPDGPSITIRQLLTHTSGLPREASFPYWSDNVFPTRDQLIEAFHSQESVFEPETKYKYSNLGMAILGEIVAAVSGQSYERFIHDAILRPLGMNSTSVYIPEEQRTRLATGYSRPMKGGVRKPTPFMDAKGLAPAANISSTVEDLAAFASFHLREDDSCGTKILKPSTLREMHRVHWLRPNWKKGCGLGFFVVKGVDRVTFAHDGWASSQRSYLLISPEEKVAVVVMTNSDDGSPGLFAGTAMSMLAPVLRKAAVPPTMSPVPDPAWQRYVGKYADSEGLISEVFVRNGALVLYEYDWPPEDNPTDVLIELTPTGKDSFCRGGEDGDGEPVVFELGKDGRVVKMKIGPETRAPVH
jgi:CubicO group peptidase (beta-lactamase class C family)